MSGVARCRRISRGLVRLAAPSQPLPQPLSLLLPLLLAICLASGCAESWTVLRGDAASVSATCDDCLRLSALRSKLSGEHWIVLRDSSELLGDSLVVRRDSTRFVDADTRAPRAVPTASVAVIRSRISPTRAFFAVAAGLLVGPLVFGGMTTAVISSIVQVHGEQGMVLLVPLVGGGAAGAVIGPIAMYTSFMKTYEFPP